MLAAISSTRLRPSSTTRECSTFAYYSPVKLASAVMPLVYSALKTKQSLKRGSLTIAAGFRANDGIVLCADTQQTIGGYVKTYDGKVDLFVFKDKAIAIAGAGNVDYIRTATDAIVSDFDTYKTWPEVQVGLKAKAMTFFDEHLARWAPFSQHERPSVELLIGVTGVRIPPTLFHYEGTSFVRTSTKAIGSGVLLANALIQRYCFGDYSVNQLGSLAVYILSKVKEGVEGCGGSTHVIGLRKGRDFALTDDKKIKDLENKLLDIENRIDKSFIKAVTSRPLTLSWQSEYRKKVTQSPSATPPSKP